MFVHGAYCKHGVDEKASIVDNFFCKIPYMNPIGFLLKKQRLALDLSQEDVAAKVRKLTGETFSRAALAQIESGETKNPKPRNLQAACDVLGIDFRSALDGKLVEISINANLPGLSGSIAMESNVSPGPTVHGKVPLISWVQAGHASEVVDLLNPGDGYEWIDTTCQIRRHTYALRVQGDSMSPDFPEGCIIVVEPELDPLPGDFVIARNGDDEATFKQLIKDGADFYLKPLNPRYPIKLLGTYQVIGVVRELVRRFR
jgi:SOS-response transcriptional repressor LexA